MKWNKIYKGMRFCNDYNAKEWHIYFAWFPVDCQGTTAWLETVMRQRDGISQRPTKMYNYIYRTIAQHTVDKL